jgi:hypothetical protein
MNATEKMQGTNQSTSELKINVTIAVSSYRKFLRRAARYAFLAPFSEGLASPGESSVDKQGVCDP